MKKTILFILAIFLVSSATFSQWEKKYYVDDFGDKTEDYYYSMITEGTFSNSATQDSELIGAFIHNEGKSLLVKVYEYGRSLATSTKHTFETVKVKKQMARL